MAQPLLFGAIGGVDQKGRLRVKFPARDFFYFHSAIAGSDTPSTERAERRVD